MRPLPLEMGAFLRWWEAGLLGCLPLSVRRLLIERPPCLIVVVRGQEISFLQEAEGELQEMEAYPLQALMDGSLREQGPALLGNAKQVVLRLPADQVLAKIISLPLAAEANLRQVVGFEIDRLTPFTANRLYYDIVVLERQPDLKRLKIKFIAAARAMVDPLIKRLAEMALAPARVEVADEAAGINLLPVEQRPENNKDRFMQRLRWALLGLAIGLSLLAGVLPVWQQRSWVVSLQPKVAAVQKEAEQVFALRKELENSIETSRFLLQKKQEGIPTIELLNELTAILPDGTWVEQLEINGSELRVNGQSSQASALIGLVEASKKFHGATFLAPVTADRMSGQERFYLSAQIAREP